MHGDKKKQKKYFGNLPTTKKWVPNSVRPIRQSNHQAKRGVERKTRGRFSGRETLEKRKRCAILSERRRTRYQREGNRGDRGGRQGREARDKKRSERQIGSRWWIKFGQINEETRGTGDGGGKEGRDKEGDLEARGWGLEGPREQLRFVRTLACGENSEKGTLERSWDARRDQDGREGRGRRNEREVETSSEQDARERGTKRLAKRDFSNFLCVLSSFPGYSAESRTGRSVLLHVVSSPIPSESGNRRAARKCKGSFSRRSFSSLIIKRRESEHAENIWNLARSLRVCFSYISLRFYFDLNSRWFLIYPQRRD